MKFKPTSPRPGNRDRLPRATTDHPFRRPACAGARSGIACAALALSGAFGHAHAAAPDPPVRIVSMNLCTDQLLVALADPRQIAALSLFSHHAGMSFVASSASRWPALKSGAEQILAIAPDLVLAGAFSGGPTRSFLQSKGVRVETFVPPRNLAEARAEVERIAVLIGRMDRGRRLLSEIDEALRIAADLTRTGAGTEASTRLPRTFALERRGYVSGRQTLLSDLMLRVGLHNAALDLSVASIARISMESIVKSKPDALILESLGPAATDQGAAFLRHPALARIVPASRRIAVPAAELTCAGPALPGLINRLAGEAARVRALLAN